MHAQLLFQSQRENHQHYDENKARNLKVQNVVCPSDTCDYKHDKAAASVGKARQGWRKQLYFGQAEFSKSVYTSEGDNWHAKHAGF